MGVAMPGTDLCFLGGGFRVCHVEGCPTGQGGSACPIGQCTMRCSGDYGYLNSQGQLIFAGRRDRQIKRWGHRINLDRIQV